MRELLRRRQATAVGPGGHDPNQPGDEPLGNFAYVVSPGGHREMLPVAGLTVGEIRRRLADRLNIDSQAQPIIGTQNVADDVVLQAGEHLFFRRAAGEKGVGFCKRYRSPWPCSK